MIWGPCVGITGLLEARRVSGTAIPRYYTGSLESGAEGINIHYGYLYHTQIAARTQVPKLDADVMKTQGMHGNMRYVVSCETPTPNIESTW
ncbi:hypothetical protein F5Y12DRAFT_753693 [Xylaria sp. FL1777]|nr:hypothetical protein F5Y12DRAFT_753693 [Xylaria sp. FL1777]